MRKRKAVLMSIAFTAICCTCLGQAERVSKDEERDWINHVLPLPHEIAIASKITVPPDRIGFLLPSNAGATEMKAVGELKAFIQRGTGIRPAGNGFTIVVGVPDQDGMICGRKLGSIDRLRSVPNREQAYVIEPIGDDQLIVAGLHPKGVYYGTVTLRQLLSRQIDDKAVMIPAARIADWPDLAVRGTWSHNVDADTKAWRIGLKLNCATRATAFHLTGRNKNGPTWEDWKFVGPQTDEAAQLGLFEHITFTPHFNFAEWHGWFEKYYPELLGKGPEAWQVAEGADFGPPRQFQCVCASNPLFVDLLASQMEAHARHGIMRVHCWTTEFFGQCGCDSCKGKNQFVLETHALLKASARVRENYPDFRMIPFYSFSTSDLAGVRAKKLPPDTAQRVVDVLRGSDAEEIIRACYGGPIGEDPPFDELVSNGKTLISWALTPDLNLEGFRSYVGSYRGRIARMIRAGWRGALAFTHRSLHKEKQLADSYPALKLAAIAEWSWNNKGRDMPELARAWATVNNYACPEKFVEFLALMQPVEDRFRWGQHFTFTWQIGAFREAVEGRAEWPFVPGDERDKLTRACRQAEHAAGETDVPSWTLEARLASAMVDLNYAAGDTVRAVREKAKVDPAWQVFERAADRMQESLTSRETLYGLSHASLRNNLTAFREQVSNVVRLVSSRK
ncbi:MAG: glycoside hydrolase family 20 zincin-like fold domain-containing protein [Planctomycetota bacterium]